MNQKDAAATPMTRAFDRHHPDYTPFTAVPNRVPLTFGVSTPPSCGADTPGTPTASPTASGAKALKRASSPAQTMTAPVVPRAEQRVARQWKTWATKQGFTGANPVPDQANSEQMDHYTWYRAHNWTTPYPGESRILTPGQVPGRYLASADSDG